MIWMSERNKKDWMTVLKEPGIWMIVLLTGLFFVSIFVLAKGL